MLLSSAFNFSMRALGAATACTRSCYVQSPLQASPLSMPQVSDKEVRVGKDGVAVKHSPQEADEWQIDVSTLVAEFSTKQASQCTSQF